MNFKTFYNSIYAQVFSPCGNYLIVGDCYGNVSVFQLQNIINPSEDATFSLVDDYSCARKAVNVFQVQNDIPIDCMLATTNHLVVGSLVGIFGFSWPGVLAKKDIQPTWKIELSNSVDSFQKIAVNSMKFNEENGILYAGCSDNQVYVISIETGKVMHTLTKHEDYIHSIVNHGNNLISAGEDGLVNVWDLRSKEVVHSLQPHKDSQLERNEIGIWIGDVAVNDDWLLCGGGPRLSLWNFRSLTRCSNVFPLEDEGIHVAYFYDNKVFAGGKCPNFYQMNINSEIVADIKTTSVSIYSAIMQSEPFTAMCLSGTSPYIDICSNFNYKDQVLLVESEETN